MTHIYGDLPLGKHTDFVSDYSPELLFPIPRALAREQLGVDVHQLPFVGVDIWNAYELSWLNARGKPCVACAEFRFSCDSPAIIESKSFKLYLNSYNQQRFANIEELQQRLLTDLSEKSGAEVEVLIQSPEDWPAQQFFSPDSRCLDDLDIEVSDYVLDQQVLKSSGKVVSERLHSHLLRSLCPVTGQPDWGSVFIEYCGPAIDHAGLLQYLIGYREHQEFHEQCVERIFVDIMARCQPDFLSVYARYVRRGGLDINPFRSSYHVPVSNFRLVRQ